MTRVLFLTQSHNVWGGMEQWLHNFTKWLQDNTDWDVRVGLAWGARFNDPDRYAAAHPHMRVVRLDARAGTESARRRAIVRAIENVVPDLVVPIGLGAVFPAVAEAKRRGSNVRFVVPVRALVAQYFANIVESFPIVDGVVCVNRFFHRYFAERFPEETDRVHYVRHGARARDVKREEWRGPLRVGYVGRLEPIVKRVLDLLPFVEELERLGSPVEIHVYGDGPSELELRQRLPNVIFHGHRTQDDLYREGWPRLDVAMLFSATEGTPNAVCEAMQHGVVPVISRYQGQEEEAFVVHERNGFTFEIGDVVQAAAYVDRLARDRELLRALSATAVADVAGETAERMHRDWVTIFEKTLALPQKRGALVEEPLPRGGRLESLLPAALADRLRVLTGRTFPHEDGWGEWPGSQPP